MKPFFSLFIILCLFVATGVSAEEPQTYISVLPTVPVMDGATEITDSAVLFDKPGGRIAQTILYTESSDQSALLNFYEQTLPQLGWTPSGKNTFTREEERLLLVPLESETTQSQGTTLKVLLSPVEKK